MFRLVIVMLGAARVVGAAPAAAQERVALLPLELQEGLVASRADLELAVTRGLQITGRPIVSSDEVTTLVSRAGGELTCSSDPCWARVGASAQVGYLVGGLVGRSGATFRVSLRLVRASDGSTMATEENQCDVADCSVAELVRRSARELVRQTLGQREAMPEAPVPAAQVPPAADVARPRGAARTLLPALAVGLGAAVTGAGVALIAIDGDCADDRCRDLNDSFWPGVALTGAGVALATAGLVMLIRETMREPALVVGIAPGSVTLGGRF